MRKFIRASVLVLVLAVPAFAGYIPYGATGEIPNGANSTGYIPYGVTSTGNMPNGVTGEIPYGDISQPILIDVLLSLFSLI
jgi:hypothetical protein